MAQPRLFAIAAIPTQLQASWSNYDGTSTIYITSSATLNQVSLTLMNQLGQQLDLAPGTPVAYGSTTGSQSTLYLFFQGMLSNAEVAAIQVAAGSSPAWTLASFTDSGGLAYLALSPQKAVSIPNGGSLTVPLTNLLATSADSSGNVAIAIVTGTNEEDAQVFVNVQNPPVTTNQPLELLVGFAGTDLIFTGSQPNALTLYLTNPQATPLVPGGVSSWGTNPPTFQLSLIFGDGAGALTSVAEASNVAINLGNTFGNDYNAVAKQSQGAVPSWKVQPSSSGSGTVMGTGQNATITLNFTDIIAAQPQGLTYAYLSYSNIPGYNDGYYAIEIVKVNPIVISSFTASPGSLANATGPTPVVLSFAVQNAGYVTITNANYAQLVTEDDFSGTVTVTAYANTVYTLIASNYATGQVVSQPLVLTATTPDLLATAFAAGSAAIAHALAVGGTVGIGTSAPYSQLANTPNNIIDSQGQGGDPNSLAWEASQSGYVGQFFNAGQGTNNNGVLVKVASTSGCAFEISQGTAVGQPGLPLVHVSSNGFVGIGTSAPYSQLANTSDNIIDSTGYGGNPGSLAWEAKQDGYVGQFFNAGQDACSNGVAVKVASTSGGALDVSQGTNATTQGTSLLRVNGNGNVGIGTSQPAVPLDVQATTTSYINNYGYLNATDPTGKYSYGNSQGFPVSIMAAGRIICPEFDATSDARLKTVLGLSDSAADLALLALLRITDYQMRDQAQFGERRYKKILAQELEQVFPQAVSQHADFVPDVYVMASQVQRQDDMLALTLPIGLPQDAAAGQRLKLVGPAGAVLATLARPAAAGSLCLFVHGADGLAEHPQQVFVFGLEQPDVRAVDYDALTMLNVSATQAMLKQVDELRQQNDVLTRQVAAQRHQLEAQQSILHAMQKQLAEISKHLHIEGPAGQAPRMRIAPRS